MNGLSYLHAATPPVFSAISPASLSPTILPVSEPPRRSPMVPVIHLDHIKRMLSMRRAYLLIRPHQRHRCAAPRLVRADISRPSYSPRCISAADHLTSANLKVSQPHFLTQARKAFPELSRKPYSTMAPIQVDSAVEKDDLFIPLIDFSQYTSGTPEERLNAAAALLSGFQRAGFVYLKNHGISPSTVRSVFDHSAQFFTRPQEQKDALAWYSPRANRGYVAHGREKVTRADFAGDVEALRQAVPDLKESLEIGREGEEGCPNMWPDRFGDEEGRKFREVMEGFHGRCKELHREVMRAIALGMGLEEGWFDGFTGRGDNTLRLLHYPAVEKEVFRRSDGQVQVRAGEHSDYGSLTLLFQDDRGGLQVLSPKGTFVDATPIPDTIVVNAGDLLERWANDTIKSTKHRVVEPPPKPGQEGLDKYPARYSVAYFCNPDFDKVIEAIPGTYEEGKQKYPSVLSGDYLAKRLSETYGDLDKYELKK